MLDTYNRSGECLCCHQSIDEDISSENNLIFEEETDTRCKVVKYKRYYNDERDDFVVIPRSWQGKEVYSAAENVLKIKRTSAQSLSLKRSHISTITFSVTAPIL